MTIKKSVQLHVCVCGCVSADCRLPITLQKSIKRKRINAVYLKELLTAASALDGERQEKMNLFIMWQLEIILHWWNEQTQFESRETAKTE